MLAPEEEQVVDSVDDSVIDLATTEVSTDTLSTPPASETTTTDGSNEDEEKDSTDVVQEGTTIEEQPLIKVDGGTNTGEDSKSCS
jgi:hypothetical protein